MDIKMSTLKAVPSKKRFIGIPTIRLEEQKRKKQY